MLSFPLPWEFWQLLKIRVMIIAKCKSNFPVTKKEAEVLSNGALIKIRVGSN